MTDTPWDEQLSPEDRALIDLLRATLADADPVPQSLLAAARASLTWRTIDAELAELTADTALSGALVRGGEGPRILTFSLPSVSRSASLVVEVVRDGGLRRLLGQLVGLPPGPRVLRVQRPESESEAAIDELGHFRLDALPPGPARFAFDVAGQPAVTAWVAL